MEISLVVSIYKFMKIGQSCWDGLIFDFCGNTSIALVMLVLTFFCRLLSTVLSRNSRSLRDQILMSQYVILKYTLVTLIYLGDGRPDFFYNCNVFPVIFTYIRSL